MKGGNGWPLACEGKDLLISYVTFRNMSDPSELLGWAAGFAGIEVYGDMGGFALPSF